MFFRHPKPSITAFAVDIGAVTLCASDLMVSEGREDVYDNEIKKPVYLFIGYEEFTEKIGNFLPYKPSEDHFRTVGTAGKVVWRFHHTLDELGHAITSARQIGGNVDLTQNQPLAVYARMAGKSPSEFLTAILTAPDFKATVTQLRQDSGNREFLNEAALPLVGGLEPGK